MSETLSWRIGDVKVTRLVESVSSSLGAHILPDATPEAISQTDWLRPYVDENWRLLISFHALIVETVDRLIVVDTCVGNDKTLNYPKWNKMQNNFLADFQSLGFRTDAVDTVLCTHMHVDHVGWNTRLEGERWVPTFPNARYLYERTEWEHWQEVDENEFGDVIEESVQPIFDCNLADLVNSDHQVCPEIRLISTPGHTPGHVSVLIESKGEQAVITGDVFHHPCQVYRPDWCASADLDPATAASTRSVFLDKVVDESILVIGTHFHSPTAGRVVADGDSFRLDV